MASYLTPDQIEAYARDGAIVVRGAFKDWIEPLRAGFEAVLADPSASAIENAGKDAGRFFEDYCNWERIPEFRRFIRESPAAQIAAEATGSARMQIFHEHILVKEPGTASPTPWHQDIPYYCVDGRQTASYWLPLDPVTQDNVLRVALGTHLGAKPMRPSKWSTGASFYADDSQFMDMPDVENGAFAILAPDLELGDAVLFNYKTVHGAPGNTGTTRRRAFSARFMGDDVRYVQRPGRTSPPFPGLVLSPGDRMPEDWFPVIWPT